MSGSLTRCGMVLIALWAASPRDARAQDADGDGLSDALEQQLIQRYAPLLYLYPGDGTRPSSVDWYLRNSTMRFNHRHCSDCEVVGYSHLNQDSLVSQGHRKKREIVCSHQGTPQRSDGGWEDHAHFFIQPHDDGIHGGSSNPGDWTAYAHVYRNGLGTINVQYWHFWPYNNASGPVNHEGDWEGLTIRLDANHQVAAVHVFRHDSIDTVTRGEMTWWADTHPVVWIAEGTHASYRSEGRCDHQPMEGLDDSCGSDPAYRWFTWAGGKPAGEPGLQGAGVVNVGERSSPLSGQTWIRYSGRWGEVGETDMTSGPRGPAYQRKWMIDSDLSTVHHVGGRCCESREDGSCLLRVGNGQQCP